MSASSPAATLSQIQAWDTEHLSQAATFWSNTADSWDDAFEHVARAIANPGGMSWEGASADAALARAVADRSKVRDLADDLRTAATAARGAADTINRARSQRLHAIGEAEAEGFRVGEDLSVTDEQATASADELAARQAQAESLAADIRIKALALSAADHDAAARIASAAAGLGDVSFDEGSGGTVQAVDFKQSPGDDVGQPGGSDGDENPTYPDHKPNGEWAPGNSGVDGHAAAQHTFDEMEALGIPVVRQEVTVRVTDPNTGQTYTRRYDGLQPTGVPGQYIGIEHKVNQSPITPNQRVVDDLVRSGVPARGTLNGEPIEVTDVSVIRIDWPPAGVPDPGAAAGAGSGAIDIVPPKLIESAPKGMPDWGTPLSPEQLRQTDGPLGILQDFADAFTPPDPNDPDNTA